MKIETIAVHAGKGIDPSTGAVMPPIHLSTTFERAADGTYPGGYTYIRSENPTRRALEDALVALEGGVCAATFSSGMAAIMSVFQALRTGDHVLIPDDIYFGTGKLVSELFVPWGLAYTEVDMTDHAAVRAAIRPNTKLIWIETPSNPLLKITDVAGIAAIAHEVGAICACDSTWPTPLLLRTLELGADLAVHATTKYLAGHSDVLGGAVIAKENSDFFERVRFIQRTGGAVPSPFDCWLLLRGIRTLPYRMRAHCENARKVAEFLANHPKVCTVHYPGLASHPGHEIAAEQMKDFGGMLSFELCPDELRTGRENAQRVAGQTKIFTQATSLGGVESLIEHRFSIEGPTTKAPDNLLRCSIGLEHPDDLIADLAQALAAPVPVE
ncbi:MAG: PLP-dependent transferase [Caldilineaceae bacterium]|nr:PLP-dependent transferase [Caldilineaceae bacterium]MCB0124283.1 PLP-dependent transferase [Caldilineaceae bacterium]